MRHDPYNINGVKYTIKNAKYQLDLLEFVYKRHQEYIIYPDDLARISGVDIRECHWFLSEYFHKY